MNGGVTDDGSISDLPWATVFDPVANARALSAIQARGFSAATQLVDRFIKIAESSTNGTAQKAATSTTKATDNDVDLILQAVLDGLGIAQLPAYQVCDLLGEGQLISCLAQHAPEDGGHYLCYLSRKHLPARIRVFIDYMTEHTRALDLQCMTTMTSLSTVE